MSELIKQITDVLRKIRDGYSQKGSQSSITQLRVDATRHVAKVKGIRLQTVRDKYLRGLTPDITITQHFDDLIEKWLMEGSGKLKQILLKHKVETHVVKLIDETFQGHNRAAQAGANWQDRISINPNVCHGKPCIKGTRIWVLLVLDLLASGSAIDEVLEEYPQLTREDIQACIAYGAEEKSG